VLQAQAYVLENLKAAVQQGGRWLAEELRAIGDVSMLEFVRRADVPVRDVYGRGNRCWLGLRRMAGLPAGDFDEKLLGGLRRALHVDTLDRLQLWRDALAGRPEVSKWDRRTVRLWTMLHVLLFTGTRPSLDEGLERMRSIPGLREELLALLDVLEDDVEHLSFPLAMRGAEGLPFEVHGTYALDEIMAGIGKLTADAGSRIREGVYYHEESGHDLFFVTLKKSEKNYSPTTMYRDYAISPELFHWESQSTTRAESPSGRRYQQHGRATGTHALLFVRNSPELGYGVTSPYVFLGPADYVRHEGERPMAIVWRLHHAMPAGMFEVARVAA
jgi:hypothetical protein